MQVAEGNYFKSGLAFFTNGTSDTTTDWSERMRIDMNGKVGIGTDSPSSLLHISSGTSGDAVLTIEADTDDNNEEDNPRIQLLQDAGQVRTIIGNNGNAGSIYNGSVANAGYITSNTNNLQFGTNDIARMTISSNKVGIGTNAPAVSLHVSSTDALKIPVGTTAQRPSSAAGMIRYNSTTGSFEGYTTEWGDIGGGDDYSLKTITKNASNQFPITFADSTNFKLSASGTWTITATIAAGDVGKSGTILIVNTAATTPGALPSTFLTPNGDNIVFETDSGDVSVLSYFIASTTQVLVNYVGNFS